MPPKTALRLKRAMIPISISVISSSINIRLLTIVGQLCATAPRRIDMEKNLASVIQLTHSKGKSMLY